MIAIITNAVPIYASDNTAYIYGNLDEDSCHTEVYSETFSESNPNNVDFSESEIMICSESYSDCVCFGIILYGTNQEIAISTIKYDYTFADGSWARIENVSVTNVSNNSLYRISQVNSSFSTGPDYGMYTYYLEIARDNVIYKYKCYVCCDIYGELSSDITYE